MPDAVQQGATRQQSAILPDAFSDLHADALQDVADSKPGIWKQAGRRKLGPNGSTESAIDAGANLSWLAGNDPVGWRRHDRSRDRRSSSVITLVQMRTNDLVQKLACGDTSISTRPDRSCRRGIRFRRARGLLWARLEYLACRLCAESCSSGARRASGSFVNPANLNNRRSYIILIQPAIITTVAKQVRTVAPGSPAIRADKKAATITRPITRRIMPATTPSERVIDPFNGCVT